MWRTRRQSTAIIDDDPLPPVTLYSAKVRYGMPAMPAMGMSAMRASSTLADKGAGNYEGPLQLDSGGTWDVTVSVVRNGQSIASKKLSVNATGGM